MSQTKGFGIIIESPRGREAQYVTGVMQMIFSTLLMCIKFWVATKYEHITNKSHRKIREKICMCLLLNISHKHLHI